MANRWHGHVRVNARAPEAAGICDRCGAAYQRNRLIWQYDWRGEQLQNLRFLVCLRCLDDPQEQLRARIIGPDPLPIQNPRPEPFAPTGISNDETNYFTAEDGATRLICEIGGADSGLPLVLEGNNPDAGIGP